ncbi:MAG: tetratricopeptide repeat protein [Pseudomonadota bacterium]
MVAATIGGAAYADDFTDGLAAFDAGDYAETVRIWTPLAEQGDAAAQVGLAGLYRSGQGVPRDVDEAARLYRAAAEQGNDDGQLNLGRMYADGTGVPHDLVQAYAWLSLAAEQGRGWADRRRQELQAGMSAAQLAEAEQQIATFAAR